MGRNADEGALAVVLGTFLVVLIMIGMGLGRTILREDAIKNGVAHWTVDSKTGATTFEWKVCE
jgi:hypothetical protein